MNKLFQAQHELLEISQTWPKEFGSCALNYFGSTDSTDVNVFQDGKIVKSVRLWDDEEDPASIPAQLRAYLATLSEPQMATDAGGRWIAKD